MVQSSLVFFCRCCYFCPRELEAFYSRTFKTPPDVCRVADRPPLRATRWQKSGNPVCLDHSQSCPGLTLPATAEKPPFYRTSSGRSLVFTLLYLPFSPTPILSDLGLVLAILCPSARHKGVTTGTELLVPAVMRRHFDTLVCTLSLSLEI